MRLASLCVVATIGLTLTACGPSEVSKATSKAPQTQAEAGILVKGSAEGIEAIKSMSTSYRVISAEHDIIEAHGLSEAQIQAIAPGIQTEPNKVYQRLLPSIERKTPWAMDAQQSNGNALAAPVGPQAAPPIFAGCDLQAEKTPTPEISLIDTPLNDKATIELGSLLKLSSDGSKAHADNPSVLENRWVIFAPSRSKIKDDVQSMNNLEVTPDNVGFYQIALVTKDDKGACGLQVARFIVSWNPEVNFPQAGENKPSVDLVHFDHLPRVEAEQAWQKAKGKGVVVAVLDTGLNYNHPAIRFNLAANTSEMNGSQNLDDDNNNFKDDILGWDFINGDNMPFDDEGHGSHVSGLIASHIFGIAPEAQIMPLKVLNGAGSGDAASILAAVYYAADNGATVINGSFGGPLAAFEMLKDGMEYAHSKGVASIVASGNGDENGIGLDLGAPGVELAPVELNISSIVAVAATDEADILTSYSNYGDIEVDVAAPGGDSSHPMWSLATQNALEQNFAPSAGTSMASPVVAGIAALVRQVNPDLTPDEVKDVLIKSGQRVQALEGKVVSGKVISALDAIEIANPLLP